MSGSRHKEVILSWEFVVDCDTNTVIDMEEVRCLNDRIISRLSTFLTPAALPLGKRRPCSRKRQLCIPDDTAEEETKQARQRNGTWKPVKYRTCRCCHEKSLKKRMCLRPWATVHKIPATPLRFVCRCPLMDVCHCIVSTQADPLQFRLTNCGLPGSKSQQARRRDNVCVRTI